MKFISHTLERISGQNTILRTRFITIISLILLSLSFGQNAQGGGKTPMGSGAEKTSNNEIVLRTSIILDGVGGSMHDRDIHIKDGKITSITAHEGIADFDLRGLTVLPGLIDCHIHISSHFDNDGKIVFPDGEGNETHEQRALRAASNAYATLMGGFTTVQSPGEALDRPLAEITSTGKLPGPRILTSFGRIGDMNDPGTPSEIRSTVRKLKTEGADFIKLFASSSVGKKEETEWADEQIAAACQEARAVGLRTIVHAHLDHGAQVAVRSGCTSIEHGTHLSDETLALMGQKGVYLDPNLSVTPNYLKNRDHFLGQGGYTPERFARMEENLEKTTKNLVDLIQRAKKFGVQVVLGTDIIAGSFGRSGDEIVYRVEGGAQTPMEAIISGTSLAAKSLWLEEQIGRIEPGYFADIIAIEGDPLIDISSIRRVKFVMKEGRIYRSELLCGQELR
jgi:imidazolonepropionase-like amidohydrolase